MEMETAEDLEEPARGWRLIEVRFDGLLGNEKQLVLNLDPDGTILTGQNGSGKSTILRAIACAQSEQTWHEFADLPLDGMSLRFEDDMEISFTRDGTRVTLRDESGGGEEWEVPEPIAEADADERALLRRAATARTRAEHEHFLMRAKEAALIRRMVEAEDGPVEPSDETDDEIISPTWATALDERLNVKLVATSRLEGLAGDDLLRARHALGRQPRRRSERPKLAVDQISDDLGVAIRRESSRYGFLANRLYRRLRKQAIEALREARAISQNPSSLATSKAELKAEVDTLRAEVVALSSSLATLGVIEEDDAVISSHESEETQAELDTLMVLREIYRGELEALDRLRSLDRNLRLFMEFVNERFNAKRVSIVGVEGFKIVLGSAEEIRPSELSSGEQHLLVLAYDLLFDTPSGSVVLIDEPELSLHVAWLQNLFAAFLEMGDQQHLQFIVATHSPSIVAGFGDHEQSIDELLT